MKRLLLIILCLCVTPLWADDEVEIAADGETQVATEAKEKELESWLAPLSNIEMERHAIVNIQQLDEAGNVAAVTRLAVKGRVTFHSIACEKVNNGTPETPKLGFLLPKVEADIQLDKVECARLLGDKREVVYSLYTNAGYADDCAKWWEQRLLRGYLLHPIRVTFDATVDEVKGIKYNDEAQLAASGLTEVEQEIMRLAVRSLIYPQEFSFYGLNLLGKEIAQRTLSGYAVWPDDSVGSLVAQFDQELLRNQKTLVAAFSQERDKARGKATIVWNDDTTARVTLKGELHNAGEIQDPLTLRPAQIPTRALVTYFLTCTPDRYKVFTPTEKPKS